MKRHSGLAVLSLAIGASACTSEGAEAIGYHDEPIINGTLDTTHQAVGAWLHGSKCSGTIVQVDVGAGLGYALTAAHCVGGGLGTFRQGNDHDNFDRSYDVVDATVHPEYGASTVYDFAMLTFTGADANTPVIPPLPHGLDNVKVGTTQELVGYGLTESGPTKQRHHIDRQVSFESELWLGWDQQTGGLCSGDSGGAALHVVSGQEHVSGVHSFVSNSTCDGVGVSVRVSAVTDTFIEPYINGTAFLPQSCNECADAHTKQGACKDEIEACFSTSSCENYVDCLNGCSDNACAVQCALDHPAGKGLYDDIIACICDAACVSECASAGFCEPPAACWLEASDPSCQSCLDGSCCAEATDCAADAFCDDCITSAFPNPNCDADPTVQALSSCLESNCGPDCSVGTGGAGGVATGAGGAGGAGGANVGVGGSVGAGAAMPSDEAEDFVVEEGCACRTRGGRGGEQRGWLLALLGLLGGRRRAAR